MRTPYFASSSRVWDSIEWVYGIEDCGYSGWEISAEGNFRLDVPENLARIREVLDSTSLGATVHAPYSDLNLASLNHAIYRESIRQVTACILHAADFSDRVTVHPGYLSPAGKLVPDRVWNLHREALKEIGRASEDSGVLTCLENMINIEEFLCRTPWELFGMTEDIPGIGVTIDIGHANTVGELDQFLSYIPKADHLHLHDNHGSRDEHLALGDGEIPWETVGPLVREGYSGVCVIEGRNLVEARQSLEVFRRWF